jgi:hypothetical protein
LALLAFGPLPYDLVTVPQAGLCNRRSTILPIVPTGRIKLKTVELALPENPLGPPFQNIFQVAFSVQHSDHLQRDHLGR